MKRICSVALRPSCQVSRGGATYAKQGNLRQGNLREAGGESEAHLLGVVAVELRALDRAEHPLHSPLVLAHVQPPILQTKKKF